MIEVKRKIRSCETAVLLIGLFAAFVLTLIWYKAGNFYHAFLIGYSFGFTSFVLLAESFSAFEKTQKRLGVVALLLSNFKLLAIGLMIFALKTLGFSVLEMIFGLFFSQLAIGFSLLFTLSLDKKSAEEYKDKIKNART
ncbi:MAG: hypothetical protein KKB51_18415 [Candidatus Riflebacteria bacterium]|nr:hypothetical protein [Candidatus Riflebacteria bacterium]